jgi:hypothetical protein
MFRQVTAIIGGVEVPWKLLRQDLYCGCVWITIHPVWLVVGGCSQACTVGSDPEPTDPELTVHAPTLQHKNSRVIFCLVRKSW